jgi:hypothetical protein
MFLPLPFLRYMFRRHLEEIIILQDFLEHQEAANASPRQEDPYIHPAKILNDLLAPFRNYGAPKQRYLIVKQ